MRQNGEEHVGIPDVARAIQDDFESGISLTRAREFELALNAALESLGPNEPTTRAGGEDLLDALREWIRAGGGRQPTAGLLKSAHLAARLR